jgi:choline dehydrogenase-like flavoprotein
VLRFGGSFGVKRFLARKRRAPGFFVYNAENRYPLQYHGEQVPNPKSRVTLGSSRNALGMPKLCIDLRFSQDDADGMVRWHNFCDDYLKRTGCGELEYLSHDPAEAVWSRIGGGFHQLGTTRMASRYEDGVVDENLAVHGVKNLFVASSSVFPTAGQANPTFMIVVLALRLSDRLQSLLGQL